MARLYADVCLIHYTPEVCDVRQLTAEPPLPTCHISDLYLQDLAVERLLAILPTVKVPPFRPSSKVPLDTSTCYSCLPFCDPHTLCMLYEGGLHVVLF